MLQANDEQIFDKSAGMKISIESRDYFYGLVGIIRDVIKIQIVRRYQLVP